MLKRLKTEVIFVRKNALFRDLREFVIINLGSLGVATAVFFFMMPSQVAVGSISALSMVLANFLPVPMSVINLIINVLLLIVGFLLVGSEFGAKTVYTSIMIPLFVGVFEFLLPNFQSLTSDPLLDVLCYIVIVSISMALLFLRNASSGGLDIVAKILHKYLRMEFGKAGSLCGIAVALSSVFCYDTKTVVLSVLATYFCGIVVDYFIFGLNIKRRVCIISPKLDEIVDYILHGLHSGATLNEITGAYDNTQRKEVITIVDKNEYRKLMEFVRKTDPKAFVTVYAVSEIRYQPKIWK
ncbi:MAG: YitT family protein [Clostridia bacterium]|nr:YitT family protein [Clostridia bacterium]